MTPPGADEPTGGLDEAQAAVMADAIEVLKKEGAIVIDPADIPSVLDPDPARNLLKWDVCSGVNGRKGHDPHCSVVLKYGAKRDFNLWLDNLGPDAPVKTLSDLRFFNLAHAPPPANAIRYGQSELDISDEMDLVADRARYETDRQKDLFLTATHGMDEVMEANGLDAILFPGAKGAGIAARPGYPTVIVPFGMVVPTPTPAYPEGFDVQPEPFGVSFTGRACSEPRLLEIAYAFEQATKRRIPPPSTP